MAKRASDSNAAKPKRTAKPVAAQRRKTTVPRTTKGAGRTAAAPGALKTHARPKKQARRGSGKPVRRVHRFAPPPPPAVAPTFGPPPPLQALGSTPSPVPAQAPAAAPREPEGLPAFIDRGAPIPDDYKLDRLMAMARDPQWLFCYWELHGPKLPELRAQRGQEFLEACAWALRLYRLNEGTAVDVEIEPAAGNWYVHVGAPGKYQLELALLSPGGEWVSLLVSEVIEMPREGLSDVMDEEWRLSPEEEERLLREALALAEARKRGISGFLGASRLRSSFGPVSSMMLGASASGRPVAGSWAWSAVGGSGRVPGSGSGAGGLGWLVAPSGAQEPALERPQAQGGGPNWNAQAGLPAVQPGKTQQPHFKVRLPRVLHGLPLPVPSRREYRVLSAEC